LIQIGQKIRLIGQVGNKTKLFNQIYLILPINPIYLNLLILFILFYH